MFTQSTPLANSASDDAIESLLHKGLIWSGSPTSGTQAWQDGHHHTRSIPFGSPEIDDALPAHGLTCDAIHEFIYEDPTGLEVIPALLPVAFAKSTLNTYLSSSAVQWKSRNDKTYPYLIVWIGKRSWPAPFALNLDYSANYLFLDPPDRRLALWAIETALRSPVVQLVIADCPRLPLTLSRRFSIIAQSNHSTALLLFGSIKDRSVSAAATQWIIHPYASTDENPHWRLELRRIKGHGTRISSWIINSESCYAERAEIPLSLFSTLVDGYHSEEDQSYRTAS